jgi:hypothetical protein
VIEKVMGAEMRRHVAEVQEVRKRTWVEESGSSAMRYHCALESISSVY